MKRLSTKDLRNFFLIVAAAAALSLSYFRVFENYELQTYDWRCQLRGSRPVSDRIVMVDIWDDALEAIGAWPFNREYHAELLRILGENGAKAVGFDILFAEPREGDEAFVKAAENTKIAYFVYGFSDIQVHKGLATASHMAGPLLPSYARAAKNLGHVNPISDADGKIRRLWPVIRYQGKDYYHLGFSIGRDLLGGDPSVPLDEDGAFIVNYAGTWEKAFKHVSYLDVLAADQEKATGKKPRLDLSQFKNKVCFVGLTSLGSHDTKAIPIQSVYPMLGMHANTLNGLLMKDYIRRLDRVSNTAILALLMMLIFVLCRYLRPLAALGAVIGVLAGYLGLVTLSFLLWGVWINLFFPFMLSIAIYAVATLSQAMIELQKREVIEKELKIASQIQLSFLPEHLPENPYLDLAVYMKPAKAVGGDLYAFLPFSEDRLGVMVGDVSGKGTPAALFMAKAVSEFKFSARDKDDPAAALSGVNESISSEATGGLFVTMSYVIFEPKKHRFLLSNGGHLPLAVINAQGGTELLSAEEGMPIGVLPGVAFADLKREISTGEIFALYSDGVSEARNTKAQEYDVESLLKTMRENRERPAQEILNRCVEGLNRFMGKAQQHDDITLIILKVSSLPV